MRRSREYETALRMCPTSSMVHNSLGGAYTLRPKRSGDAIREFEAAIEDNPNNAEAHFNLGAMLARTPEKSSEGDGGT